LNAPLKSRVSLVRKQCEVTQQQLAELAGVSRQTVVELEKGNYNPSTALALRLAVLLDTSVEELFQLPTEESNALRKLRPASRGLRSETDKRTGQGS
jgi:putative transcriptional regulator